MTDPDIAPASAVAIAATFTAEPMLPALRLVLDAIGMQPAFFQHGADDAFALLS